MKKECQKTKTETVKQRAKLLLPQNINKKGVHVKYVDENDVSDHLSYQGTSEILNFTRILIM